MYGRRKLGLVSDLWFLLKAILSPWLPWTPKPTISSYLSGVGWYHRRDGCEFEQAPRVGDGQGSLTCCSPCGQSDKTE